MIASSCGAPIPTGVRASVSVGELQSAREAELMSDRLRSTATRFLLEFIDTGTDFRPTPSTQQILADINAKTVYRPLPRTTPPPLRSKGLGAAASSPRPASNQAP